VPTHHPGGYPLHDHKCDTVGPMNKEQGTVVSIADGEIAWRIGCGRCNPPADVERLIVADRSDGDPLDYVERVEFRCGHKIPGSRVTQVRRFIEENPWAF
jgi:hypothetical protein